MKVGFISNSDVYDKRAWSGTINFLYETLNKEYDMYPIVIEPKIIQKMTRIITKGKRKYTLLDSFFYKLDINRKIKKAQKKGIKVFFAPAASTILGVAKIPIDCKVVYLSDATYHCMLNYYYFNENKGDIKNYNRVEQKSLCRADKVIFSSEWAKNDAIIYYGTDSDKIHVLPFGANLEDKYSEHDMGDIVKILFVGVEWERKGAELAIECVKNLNRRNYKKRFELTIIGLEKPEKYLADDSIHFVGRLNKNNQDELNRMIKYYQQSDIFLLPTKAECSAIVFSEAAMYGLPVFTHNTGGVMTYIEDGKTGRGLKLGSKAEDFADAILEMLNEDKYKEWSINARKKFEKELNWNCWVEKCKELIEN